MIHNNDKRFNGHFQVSCKLDMTRDNLYSSTINTFSMLSHNKVSVQHQQHNVMWHQLVGATLETDPRNRSAPADVLVSNLVPLSKTRSNMGIAHQLDTALVCFST